ncbi:Uu.00g102560.m01.CDS01 [Anthostomella pinea]|uniref:Uu.00g102560.m01.CDS01 n=1 Tax=Anthostomella pinea TaxID=933095 RepID=A0AAI8YFF3_9PEZI|nr:Uu.00g102560.m01.CDS01 [Anthostomella pinea]
MDQYASALLAFPPETDLNDNALYDQAARSHLNKLSKLLKERSNELVTYGPQLLELLDPSVNSLSYLAVLYTLVIPGLASSASREFLLEKVTVFLMTFDGRQCRYAGSNLLEIMGAVGSGQLLPPSVAVGALASAVLNIDPTGTMLTSSYLMLAKLAYHTDNIDPALQVIDKNIVFYPNMNNHGDPDCLCDLSLSPPSYITRDNGLTATMKPAGVMEYDLLCGLMFCSRRDWAKAFAAFERVVTFPTREGGASKLMAEAYKKWVLVSLLLKGKQSELPSYTGGVANKLYGVVGKAYTNLASLFVTEDVQALRSEAEKNGEIWLEDCNMGLVQEVLAAYQKWRVLGLQDVYTKITISEIRKQTTSAETGEKLGKDEDVRMLIQNMIIGGMLNGVIEKNDDGTDFLTFLSPTTQLSEQDFAKELARTAMRLKQLQPIFKATNERLGTNKDYVKHLIKESKRTDKGDGQDPTLGFDSQVDDEDLMGGIITTS